MIGMRLEKTIDYDRFGHAYVGGIEDWLLVRRPAAAFGFIGCLAVLAFLLLAPSFDNALFSAAYGSLAVAAAGFALVAANRTGTVIKFETGPRFLDIPRSVKAFQLAGLLVLPCVLLQIIYPLGIVLRLMPLSSQDLKPAYDLLQLIDEMRKSRSIVFRVQQSQGPSDWIDEAQIALARDTEIPKTEAFAKRADDDYEAIAALTSMYPVLDFPSRETERDQLRTALQARKAILQDMKADGIALELKKTREALEREVDLDRKYNWDFAVKADMDRLKALDQSFTYNLPSPGISTSCRNGADSVSCRLVYRFLQLSNFRERSFGSTLFPEGSDRTAQGLEPLYTRLFGLEGVLPVIAIAVTFGAFLRIMRLTTVRWPYATGMVGIVGMALVTSFFRLGDVPVVELSVEDLSVVFRLFWGLAGCLFAMFAIIVSLGNAYSGGESAVVRISMLGLPTAVLLSIEPVAGWKWAWLLAAIASVLVAFAIRRLDVLMQNTNARPRLG
jgi:hypothetical protein